MKRILAIKFKFLGDVAILSPSLRALKDQYPEAQLDCLVAEEAVPIIKHLPWINHVYGLPRKRGKSSLKETWPLLKQLRRNRYDLSVDFVGNDRGALVSRVIGADTRLGPDVPLGFWGRKHCYTQRISEGAMGAHEILRDLHILSALEIRPPDQIKTELVSDPSLTEWAHKQLPRGAILCHLSTSMPKKEWPIHRWVEFYHSKEALQERFVFSSGPSAREQALLDELQGAISGQLKLIRKIPDIAHLMALIDAAAGLVCGDSVPGHLAAGLKTPVLVLFGPTSVQQWEPRGDRVAWLWAGPCDCYGHPHVCQQPERCTGRIQADTAADELQALLDK
ncbi:MAG: glycosyltransferase family 9 protein [Verrucomicrobiota bacterium]